LVDAGGQLALTTAATGEVSWCRNCGQPVCEYVTVTSRVWVHVGTGEWWCTVLRPGVADPAGVA
jgi:hypothetical protein